MIRRIALFVALACISAPLAMLTPSASAAPTTGAPTISPVVFGCDSGGLTASYANLPTGPVTPQIEWTFTQGTVVTHEHSYLTITGPSGTFVADYPSVPVGPFQVSATITADGHSFTYQTTTPLSCIAMPAGGPTIAPVLFGCDARGLNASYANFPAGPVTGQITWTFTQGTHVYQENSSVTFTGPAGTFVADYPTVPVGAFQVSATIIADGHSFTFQTTTPLTCIAVGQTIAPVVFGCDARGLNASYANFPTGAVTAQIKWTFTEGTHVYVENSFVTFYGPKGTFEADYPTVPLGAFLVSATITADGHSFTYQTTTPLTCIGVGQKIAPVVFGCDARGLNASYANFPTGPVTAQIKWTFTQGTVVTVENSSVTFTGPAGTFVADYPTVPVGAFQVSATITADGHSFTYATVTPLTCIPAPTTPPTTSTPTPPTTTTPTTTPTPTTAPVTAPVAAPVATTLPPRPPASKTTLPPRPPASKTTLPPRPPASHHQAKHHKHHRFSCSKLAAKSHAKIGPQGLIRGVATLVAGAPDKITSITVSVYGASGHVWSTHARGNRFSLRLNVSSKPIFGVDPRCGCTYGPADRVAVTFHTIHAACPPHTIALPFNNQDPLLPEHRTAK